MTVANRQAYNYIIRSRQITSRISPVIFIASATLTVYKTNQAPRDHKTRLIRTTFRNDNAHFLNGSVEHASLEYVHVHW